MQTYTPTQGLTPAGTQLAQGQPSAANSVPPPGSPASSYPSDQSLNASYAGANQNLITANLPGTRQALVNNSDVPAEQGNYDQLAKQLFEYDQGTLAPQFQGSNPGMPTDAASFGRVDSSPLAMTMQSAGLPASQGLSVATNDPKYALLSQSEQAGSLSNLLDTLNRAISTSMTDVKGKNVSNVNAAQSALDTIYKIMSLKQDAVDKANARANAGGLAGQKLNDAENRLLADAKKGATFTDLVMRYTPDGLTPSEIRDTYNQVNYYKKPATESEQDVMDILNGNKPAGVKAKQQAADAKKSADFAGSVADQIFSSWKKMGPEERALAVIPGVNKISAITPNYTNMDSLFYGDLLEAIRKAGVGGRITQYEITWMHDKMLPGPYDSPTTAQNKVNALKQGLSKKMQDPNYNIASGSVSSSVGSPVARQQAVSSLKSAGYNNDQIHEYLRRKGIDK